MLVGHRELEQTGYDFEELAKWCEDEYCSLAVGVMTIEEELLDDFENELEDARYFEDAK